MTVEDCIIIGGSQLRWYLPSVAPRTSTVWYGVIFLSETRRQLVHRHNLPPAQYYDVTLQSGPKGSKRAQTGQPKCF